MATSYRKDTNSVTEDLCSNTYEYSFFHALRLLQNTLEDFPPIGDAKSCTDEPFRLKQETSLRFASSTISKAEYDDGRNLLNMSVLFLGLTGPNGAMPSSFTEHILERKRDFKDDTLEAFLNIFHHRILTLFYKAWVLCNQVADSERGSRSRFMHFFSSLQGLAEASSKKRDHLSDESKLYFSSLMNGGGRAAEKLESVLGEYFGVPIDVNEFEGHWLELPEEATCRLGSDPDTGALGVSAIVGSKIWDCQQKFRIVVGPLDRDQMRSFLPTGENCKKMKDWIHYFCGIENDWDIEIVVKKEEVPMANLGSETYLGWTTWLKSEETHVDSHDLVVGSRVMY
jgi:type VI secretion system protein ImpH